MRVLVWMTRRRRRQRKTGISHRTATTSRRGLGLAQTRCFKRLGRSSMYMLVQSLLSSKLRKLLTCSLGLSTRSLSTRTCTTMAPKTVETKILGKAATAANRLTQIGAKLRIVVGGWLASSISKWVIWMQSCRSSILGTNV